MSCSRSNRTRTRIKNDEEDINTINSTEITNNSPIEMENKQTNTNTTTNNSTKMSNYGLLNWEQVQRLDELLNKPIPIHGRYSSFSANSGVNYSSSSTASTPSPSPSPQQQQYSSSSAAALPTLNVKLKDFIRELNKRLISRRVNIKEIRINGGVASYVLAKDHSYQFSDIDIIFSTDLLQMNDEQNDTNDSSYTTTTASISPEACFNMCCDQIRDTVFDCLIDHMPADIERPTRSQIRESYVKKMVKIYESNPSGAINNGNNSNGDNECESFESQKSLSRWSLISLHNIEGQNIELKFVDKMKRQFQFSVDAFQIHIDTLLKYYDCQDSMNNESSIMNANLYPSVRAESMYGEFSEALAHLNEKLIATKSPEQIRGGGLLKYCNLLIRGYKPVCDLASMHALEKYMCSRFFIDFSDLKEQEHKLVAYLDSHFQNDSMMCQAYLTRLYHVVNASTVCLMGHERKQTLNLIESLAQRFSSSNFLQQQQANVQSSATGGLSTNSSSSSLLLASASASSLMSSSSSNLNAGTDNMMINRVEFGLDEIVSSSSSNNEHVNSITISNNRVINNNSDGQQNSLSTSATTTTTTTTTSGSTSSSDIEMSENEFVIRHNHHNYNHNNSHNQRANQSTAAVYFYHSQNQYHPNYNQQQYQQQFQQPNYQQPINKQHHKNKNRQYSNNNNNQNYFHTNNNANSNNTNNNYNQNQQNRNNFNSAYNSNKYWQQHPAQMGRAPNLNNNRKSFNPNNNYYYNQQQQQQQYQAYHTFDSNNNKQPNHPYYLYYGYYPPTPGVAGNGEYQQYLMTSMTGANSSSATSPAGSSVSTASSSGGSSGLILSPSPSPSPSVASSSYETTSSLTLVVAASTSSSSQIKESSDEVKVGSRSSSSSSSSSSSEAPSPSPSPPPPMPATEATSETASSASDAPLNRVFYCKLLPNTNSYIEVFDNCFCPPIIVDDEDRTNSATTTSNSSSIITTAARIVTTMNTNTNTDAAVTS